MIRLSGPADYSRLLKIPAVEATVDTGQSSQSAPASFQRVESNYEILIDTSSLRLPPTDQVSILVSFDSFFVPKSKGKDSEVRELVVKAPTLVQLSRK